MDEFDDLASRYGLKLPKPKNPKAEALRSAADKLGVDAADLGSIISFESGGSFDPHKVGGEGNKYKGLIQFGPDEQQKYYKPGQTFEDQLNDGVVRYFKDRFKKAGRDTRGASLEDLYTTVIAGNPGANRNAKDSFGTSARSGTQRILKEHRPKVLENFFGGTETRTDEFDSLMDRYGLNAETPAAPEAPDFTDELSERYGLTKPVAIEGQPPLDIPRTPGKAPIPNVPVISQPEVESVINEVAPILDTPAGRVLANTTVSQAEAEAIEIDKNSELLAISEAARTSSAAPVQDDGTLSQPELQQQYARFLEDSGVPDSPEKRKEFNDILAQQPVQQAVAQSRTVQSAPEPEYIDKLSALEQKYAKPSNKPKTASVSVNPTGGNGRTARDFSLDEAASQLSAQIGVDDYKLVRERLEKDPSLAALTNEVADRAAENRTPLTFELDNAAVNELKAIDSANKQAQKARQKQYDDELLNSGNTEQTPFAKELQAKIKSGIVDADEGQKLLDEERKAHDDWKKETGFFGLMTNEQASRVSRASDLTADPSMGGRRPVGISSEDVQAYDDEGKRKDFKSKIAAITREYGSFTEWKKAETEIKKKYGGSGGLAILYAGEAAIGGAAKAPLQGISSALKSISIGAEAVDKALGNNDTDATKMGFYGIGKDLEKITEEYVKINKDFKGGKFELYGNVLGQVGVQSVLGALTGGATMPALLGAGMGVAQQYDEATKKGAKGWSRLGAAGIGGLLAGSDYFIMKGWFKGASAAQKVGFLKQFSDSVKDGLISKGILKSEAEKAAKQVVGGFTGTLLKYSKEGGKEAFQESILEAKGNDLYAYATYDNTPERLKQLSTYTGDNMTEGAAGFIGGIFGAKVGDIASKASDLSDTDFRSAVRAIDSLPELPSEIDEAIDTEIKKRGVTIDRRKKNVVSRLQSEGVQEARGDVKDSDEEINEKKPIVLPQQAPLDEKALAKDKLAEDDDLEKVETKVAEPEVKEFTKDADGWEDSNQFYDNKRLVEKRTDDGTFKIIEKNGKASLTIFENYENLDKEKVAAVGEIQEFDSVAEAKKFADTYKIQPPSDTKDLAIVSIGTPTPTSPEGKLKEQRNVARRESETDPLTGVPNRRALDLALPSAEADADTSVIAFDANNFGKINKVVGEKEGDKVLKEMATALDTAAKENGGRVFRKGGDEFSIIAPKASAETIRERAEELFGDKAYKGFTVSVSGSVGQTFDEADAKLQSAKAVRKEAQVAKTKPFKQSAPVPFSIAKIVVEPVKVEKPARVKPVRQKVETQLDDTGQSAGTDPTIAKANEAIAETKPDVQTEADNEVESLPISERVKPADVVGVRFTKDAVAGSVDTEKINKKTGFTPTQTEWFVKELQKGYEEVDPKTVTYTERQMELQTALRVERNTLLAKRMDYEKRLAGLPTKYRKEKGPQLKAEIDELNGKIAEKNELLAEREGEKKFAYVVKVPGDGTFKLYSRAGIDVLHKKLTGKTVQEFHDAKKNKEANAGLFSELPLPKNYTKIVTRAKNYDGDIPVGEVNNVIGDPPPTSRKAKEYGLTQESAGFWKQNKEVDGVIPYELVMAKPIEIVGFEDFDLFTHKNTNGTGEIAISDAMTGLQAVSGVDIATAIGNLKRVGVEALEKSIIKNLATGVSPRYSKSSPTLSMAADGRWNPDKYDRVMPRDLFNEAKALTMHLKLIDDYNAGKLPEGFEISINGDAPRVSLSEDGELFLPNFNAYFNGDNVDFTVTYNAGKNDKFPMIAMTPDQGVVTVYDSEGDLDSEFTDEFGDSLTVPDRKVEKPEAWGKSAEFYKQLGVVGLWEADRMIPADFEFDLRNPENGFQLDLSGEEITSKNVKASYKGEAVTFSMRDGNLRFKSGDKDGLVLSGREMSDDFREFVGADEALAKKADDSSTAQMEAFEGVELSEILDNAKVEVKGDTIELKTFEAMEVVRRLEEDYQLSQGKGRAILTYGSFLPPTAIDHYIKTLGTALKTNPDANLKAMRDAFLKVRNLTKQRDGVASAIVYGFEDALPHEKTHRARFVRAMGTGISNRYSDPKTLFNSKGNEKAYNNYLKDEYFGGKGWDRLNDGEKAIAHEETITFITTGDRAKLGLTLDEAADLFKADLDAYVEKNGEKILDDIEALTDERIASYGAITQIREKKPSQTRESVQGREKGQEGRSEADAGTVRKRSLPGTLREAGLEAEDDSYNVFSNKEGIESANKLINDLGLEKAIRMVEASTNYDKTHAVMSFMLQRALRNEAAVAEKSGDVKYAEQLRKRGLELASKHAELATKAGQFTQAAAMVADSVESVTYRAQKIADKRGKPLSTAEYHKLEELGLKAENQSSDIERLTKDIRNLKSQVKRLKDDKPRKTSTRVNRRAIETAKKSLPDLSSLVKDIKNRLREGTLSMVASGTMSAVKPVDPNIPKTLYHGGPKGITEFKKGQPIFLTVGESGANWYAVEKSDDAEGQIYRITPKFENVWDLRGTVGDDGYRRDNTKDFIILAQEAGVDLELTEYPANQWGPASWEFFSNDIGRFSPFDGSNVADLIYIPKVREAIEAKGYDAIRLWDALENSEIDTVIGWDPAKLEMAEETLKQAAPKSGFAKWFGKSQVVDKNGAPLVVYHGSPDTRFVNEGGVFKTQSERVFDTKDETAAFFFTDSLSKAKSYADPKRAFDYQNAEEGVIETYLRLENPLTVDAKGSIWRNFTTTIDGTELKGTRAITEYAQKNGFDGIIVKNVKDRYNSNDTSRESSGTVYAAFSANQIKSTANNGEFSTTDDNILKQSAPNPLRAQLAQYGAALIIDKPLNKIDREGFYKDIRQAFGNKVDDILPQVFAESFNLRQDLLSDAKKSLEMDSLKQQYPNKSDKELKAIQKQSEQDRKTKRESGALAKRLATIYSPIIAKQTQDILDVIEDISGTEVYEYAERFYSKESNPLDLLRKNKALYKQAQDAITEAKQILKDEKELRAQNIAGSATALRDLQREEFLKRDAANNLRKDLARAYRRLEENTLVYYGKEGMKLLGESRSILASGDLSGSLRQGFYSTVTNPLLNLQGTEVLPSSFGTMFKGMLSKENFADRMLQIENHPNFDIMKRMGVEFAEAGGGLAEENVRTEYLKSVPVLRAWLGFSERTYAGFLDAQRALWADSVIQELESEGLNISQNEAVYKAAGALINVATGRGNIGDGKVKSAIETFGGVFFAPRFLVSRIQLLGHVSGGMATLPPAVRKIEAKRALRFHTAITLPMAALVALGIVSIDPDDDDFLKIRIGEKARYEATGGLQGYIRIIARVGKEVINGLVTEQTFKQSADNIAYKLKKFGSQKLAPVPSYAYAAATGKEGDTTEFNWLSGIYKRLIPITIKEMTDGAMEDGVAGALLTAPTIFGIGTGYYPDRTGKDFIKSKSFQKSTTDQVAEMLEQDKAAKRDFTEIEKALKKKVSAAQKAGTFTVEEAKNASKALGYEVRANNKKATKFREGGTDGGDYPNDSVLTPAESIWYPDLDGRAAPKSTFDRAWRDLRQSENIVDRRKGRFLDVITNGSASQMTTALKNVPDLSSAEKQEVKKEIDRQIRDLEDAPISAETYDKMKSLLTESRRKFN